MTMHNKGRTERKLRHVVLGAGVAGIHAAETIRRLKPDDEIVVVEKEDRRPYSRVLLPELLSGEMDVDRLWLRDRLWAERHRIRFLAGEQLVEVSPGKGTCALSGGIRLSFDTLLLATGAAPLVPPVPGVEAPNCFGLRSLEDVRLMKRLLPAVRDVLVVGGGFVGLKVAEALRKVGKNVVVVEALERLLPRVLDETGSRMLQETVVGAGGVRLVTGVLVKSFGHERGLVREALLGDGRTIPAEMVVLAVGTRPSLPEVFRGLVAAGGRGVAVDSHMRTSLEGVFAAGDVAASPGFLGEDRFNNAIWPSASSQGYIAGSNMAGRPLEHEGAIPSNVVEVFGLRVATVGISSVEGSHGNLESRVLVAGGGVYKKAVFSDGRPVGYLAIGDTSDAGLWASCIRRGRVGLRGPAAKLFFSFLA